jgi:hypothetical protein
MKALRWIKRQFGHIWCIIVHDFIMNKWKMHIPYSAEICEKCGRKWEL